MTSCRICGVANPDEHQRLVDNGTLHHQFSVEGNLQKVDPTPPPKSRGKHEVMVVPGIDLPLRTLLIQKGILSESDFNDAGSIPGFAGGNRAPGAQPSTEGSMRTPPEHP